MKTNVQVRNKVFTHEGAPAKIIDAEMQLRRSIMACMLWEKEFYEEGVDIAIRIADLIPHVEPEKVAAMAIEAREKMKLRHMPLWIVRQMARNQKHKRLVAETLARVIQRADELTEFVSLYWLDGKQPLSAQVKRGLAAAFQKFDSYQISKYNRDGAVKLRDVLFLCHAKPINDEQGAVWKKLVEGTLESPDTWEVSLSGGAEKRETWERLIQENKLGALALLRNLRNMEQSGVDKQLVFKALEQMRTERVLPFRFIAAARAVPQWESQIEVPMLKCLEGRAKLPGVTVLLVDVSGSMSQMISSKSDMKREDAASGLAILARELCEQGAIFTFSNQLVRVPDRHGFALRDAIDHSQGHNNTYMGDAITKINGNITYDRLIVITDEQSHDRVPDPLRDKKGYVINVASNQNGVGYGAWHHIDGWSEAVFDYISAIEGNSLDNVAD